jgi:LCP family protein required for cell wall assembly
MRRIGCGLGLGVFLFVVLVPLFIWWRADRALQTIQQVDPRRTTVLPTADIRVSTALPSTSSVAEPAPTNAAPLPNSLRQPINILLIGVDKRPDDLEGVRSDTLIVVHLDPQERWASLLAIPRDSVVQIPHVGWAKINAAYAYGYSNAEAIYGAGTEPDAGGGALAAEAVEQFLGVRIDYVAQVDFHGFEQVVDAVGGVAINIERPLLDAEYPTEDYGVERIYIPAGLQVLDGRHALIYARSRHSSNDFDRGRRQQQVLQALLKQVRERGLLENAAVLPQWADLLAANVRTTLPVRDLGMLNGLAMLARDLDSSRLVQVSINPTDVPIDSEDGSDIYWNRQGVAGVVARWLAGPQGNSTEPPSRIQVLNGAAVEGIAGQVSRYLQNKGFVLAEPGNAGQPYQFTTIIDYSDRPQARQRLADALGLASNAVLARPGLDSPPPPPGVDLLVIVGRDFRPEWQMGE